MNPLDRFLPKFKRHLYGYFPNHIRRYETSCCALGQLSLNNDHSVYDIQYVIEEIKKETKLTWHTQNRNGGERAIFVITTMPYEKILADKLEKLGFKKIYSFNRRNGYPEGYNDMWIISW